MNIRDLKAKITSNTFQDKFIIFECPDSYFLADQYIKEIAKSRELEITYADPGPFVSGYLIVITVDELKDDIRVLDNMIIKCKKMSNKKYNNYVVTFPVLEDWQVQNYAIANLQNISKDRVTWMCKELKYDIYKIQNEITKLNTFKGDNANAIFDQLKLEGSFKTESSVYDLINGLLRKDVGAVAACLPFNENPMGLRKLLLTYLRVIISIQSNDHQIPTNLGVADKQYNAIKRFCTGYYQTDTLVKIYKKLCNIPSQLQTGLLDSDKVLDYILINML